VTKKISPELAFQLPAILAASPDPDSALMSFERFIDQSPPEIVQLLNCHEHIAHYALVIFGYSRYLAETLLQNPDLLLSFQQDKTLNRGYSLDDFRQALGRWRSHSEETDASRLLARFKRREYLRIMLRDVLGFAPLAETTAEISALADVVIEAALAEAQWRMRARFDSKETNESGDPLPFAILSLGKLGGNELNYSSDVDLFYVYGTIPHQETGGLYTREYFVHLAQQVTEILSSVTREGTVFRIDLRLRPQGSQGELAVSISHALNYYHTAAHDWECQALIKARYSAGHAGLAQNFVRGVQAHIYTQDTNLAAIATALQARERMSKHRRKTVPRSPVGTIDVKRDPGGIRDIEFLVQCLQRVYGGADPWLRSGGTLFALQKLHDKRHIGGREFQDLTAAYVFLRHVEHRLQLRQGQQTHRLPATVEELAILQCSLQAISGETDAEALVNSIRARMETVNEIYHRVMRQQERSPGNREITSYELRSMPSWIASDQSNEAILRRLAADSPQLYGLATRGDLGSAEKKSLFRFFSAALTSSERYAAVLRHAEAVPLALKLLQTSEYLTQLLIRHPEEIATLAELPEASFADGSGYLFDGSFGRTRADRDPIFAYVASSPHDDGEKMGLLRRHYRHRMFAAGARDISECRAVYDSLAANTAAAEDAIAAAFAIAGTPSQITVLALGRLGSREFDLLSDADLLFVSEETADRRSLTKSAERMMQALAAYTREGMVFPVDARLRPHGREGELLITPSQLAVYCAQEAQPWEALMYTKLRFLEGSVALGERATSAINSLFQRLAGEPGFAGAVREMREKLESVETGNSLKTSAGGIYDIDFLSSFLLVKNRIQDKSGSLRDRLWRCAGAGLLSKPDAALLDHSAELFLTVDHVLRLVTGRASKGLPASPQLGLIMETMTSNILRLRFSDGIESELQQTYQRVREVFSRVLHA
jgi:glutamate-ammonia-ligase adenylyltransferase